MEIGTDTTGLMTSLMFTLGVVILTVSLIYWLGRLGRKKRVTSQTYHVLSEQQTRERLTHFLQQAGIVGSANIRDSVVLPMVAVPDLEEVTDILRESFYRLSQPDMRPDLYGQKRLGLQPILVHDRLDIVTLRKAFSILEQVAEDRKKSRSMFKGITDDEIDSFVRAAMVQHHKAQGEYDQARDAKSGDYDDTVKAKVAREALVLAFQVKGATI